MALSRRTSGKRTARAMAALASSEPGDVVKMTPTRSRLGTAPEVPFSAIDPHVLTIEIGLLLDYVSGRPGHSLASGSSSRLPSGSNSYQQALARYFTVDEIVRRREPIQPADMQFLLELRDYLNGQAEPATGATIAFSTLVVRKTSEATRTKADAERAYPYWIPLARSLRRAMAVLQAVAVALTVVIALIAAYAYAGNRTLANLAELSAQLKAVNIEINRDEDKTPNRADKGVHPYCEPTTVVPDPSHPETTVALFNTPTQARLCTQRDDLRWKQELAYANFGILIPRRDGKIYDGVLSATLDVLKGYVLPMLMGLLGSMAYVLRRYLRSIGDRLLTARDLREYLVRIVLGTMCGVVIGFFTSWGGQPEQEATVLAPTVSLGAPALAFLAGYGVEVVFRMLDGLAEQIFAARK